MAGKVFEPRQVEAGAVRRWCWQALQLLVFRPQFAFLVFAFMALDHHVVAALSRWSFSLALASAPMAAATVVCLPILVLTMRLADAQADRKRIELRQLGLVTTTVAIPVLMIDAATSGFAMAIGDWELVQRADLVRHGLLAAFAVFGLFGSSWLPLRLFHGACGWTAYRLCERAMQLNTLALLTVAIIMPCGLLSVSLLLRDSLLTATAWIYVVAVAYVAHVDIFEHRKASARQRSHRPARVRAYG